MVEALKADAQTASIPVVVVTAAEATPEQRKRLNGFVNAVIGKAGFDSAEFMAEVRAAVAVEPTAPVAS